MKNRMKKASCILLAMILCFSGFATMAFAAEADDVLEYRISEDGFAIVSDCDESTAGSVVIPVKAEIRGDIYEVKYIGDRAFEGCSFITDITIPEGVTAIRNHAFRDCVSLVDVFVPESLIVCQYDAFDGCSDVTVHCYKSNYQFFTVFGISANITVNVVDGKDDNSDTAPEAGEPDYSDNFVLNFIEALKRMINSIMEYFNAQEDDFEFDLPFDLPFDVEEL